MLPIRICQWALATSVMLTMPIWAQPVGSSSGMARSLGNDLLERYRLNHPKYADDKKVPDFELPALPAPNPENQPISQQLRIFCRKIELSGNTIFPATDLEKLTTPYTNREISNQELQQLRYELTRHYVDRGYINSGAIIPDQNVKNGVIEIRLIEGKLDHIEIEGNNHFQESYLRDRIELAASDPLEINQLQENLQLLLENPLIERVNADLRPGEQQGTAILKTLLVERTPYQLGLIFDNLLSPSIGSYQGTVYAAHRNLTGHGDVFSAQGRFAEGLTGYGVDYWLPMNRYDTTAHTWYSYYDSEIVEEPFNEIDVTSNSESYGVSLLHPLYREPGINLSGLIILERRRSKGFLLGEPFSFSPGVQDGRSSVTVIRIGQEWSHRGIEQVFAARSLFNIGIDALDATINHDAPDGRFFYWLGQFQWARFIGPGQIIWRSDLQLTNDPLLPLEKFQIGGVNSVRGFRENQLVRDWGFSSSLEYRYPVFSDFFGPNRFFVASFADVGGAWNVNELSFIENDVLLSLGLGVIWEPDRRFNARIYWGQPLINVHNPNIDPQDYGFHFLVAGQLF